ncbi:MAG: hypothetical protein C4533_04285 [Candidatus Omnitrophota bacterium]|jgi:O-antigen/teichoic acid export membrane protein|nr:MAG: hypothetical protein C4533_04285 [Candidatus Omnitrophota bacterium]
MINRIKRADTFSKNILIVFAGTSLVNFFNLLYQLLIAHKLSAAEFAAFNSLLSIFLIISSPIGTLQLAIAKFSSEFKAQNAKDKIIDLFSGLIRKTYLLAFVTLIIFILACPFIINILKIDSLAPGYILAAIISLAWFAPVVYGGVQGMEFFNWLTAGSISGSLIKLFLGFMLISLGFGINGALGAFFISSLFIIIIYYIPLRSYIRLSQGRHFASMDYKGLLIFLLPVAASQFCYMNLISSDMVLVKHYFNPADSGLYSLAQMVGKIFLFMPAAISLVMFPKTSGLKAMNLDTKSTLNKSLRYVFLLCLCGLIFYNIMPEFTLRMLTGKTYSQTIALGRIFSLSMTAYSMVYLMISYFLSVKDLRFIKYLIIAVLSQNILIILFHESIFQVQWIVCINSVILLTIMFLIAFRKNEKH